MDAITLSVEIREDRRLIIDLPSDTPLGQAELIIRPQGAVDHPEHNPARETARAKLLAGAALNTAHQAPVGAVALSNEELEQLGRLALGTRSSDELIDEERGSY